MKEEKPNYYAVIPANVRYDDNLKLGEKMMYGEITALSNEKGNCYASNNYFARLYKVSPQAISKWIKTLEKNKYIIITYEKNGKEIIKRTIEMVSTGVDRYQPEIKENNNIKEKELYSNKLEYSKKKKMSIFKIPTLEEIEDYCVNIRHNNIDFKYFYDFYNEANWIDSNGKQIKNWKQKIIQWEHHNKDTKVVPEFERF